jgi:hypothetical protein
MRLLDFAAIASDMAWCVGVGSRVADKQLQGRAGRVIRGVRMEGGMPQDIGMLRAEKLSDFRVVFETAEKLKQDLGRAMLLKSESGPQGEAGRSRAGWDQIAEEIDGAFGGFYAAIETEQQVPLLERTMYQMVRDGLMPAFEKDTVQYTVSTGLAAIERQKTVRKMLTLAEVAQKLGPNAAARIDDGVMLSLLARYSSIYEPRLVKSEEQVAKERKAAIDAQAMMDANKQAAQTVGGIVETAATTAMQGTR